MTRRGGFSFAPAALAAVGLLLAGSAHGQSDGRGERGARTERGPAEDSDVQESRDYERPDAEEYERAPDGDVAGSGPRAPSTSMTVFGNPAVPPSRPTAPRPDAPPPPIDTGNPGTGTPVCNIFDPCPGHGGR